MKKVLVIGSGISGLTTAIECASKGIEVLLVSPFPSERAQSVLAAGGINAALDHKNEQDSVESHIEDTLKGGCFLAGRRSVTGLCETAPEILEWLEHLGTVFSRTKEGRIDQRAFGGQSHRRTCFCGASTGKQIVTALVMEARRYEGLGLIKRLLWTDFHSGLIRDGICYGARLFNEGTRQLEDITADATVIATGGQNALFGKTTGSTQCDGYTAGMLFLQGAELKNLEFIQYHPTTIHTGQKMMLISEAARGEGGRLYYEDNGKRVYFMEDLYGENGNLMPRDVVSRTMYELNRPVFLDVTFLGKKKILERIPEIYDLCMKYRGIDISKESIPVEPSVHFFMGGLAVNLRHETNIRNLYAVGECASMYHGANRLGGNSLLAAVYSGRIAARAITDTEGIGPAPDLSASLAEDMKKLKAGYAIENGFSVMHVRKILAELMHEKLGIVREETELKKGIGEVSHLLDTVDKLRFDASELPYFNYSIKGILTLAGAVLTAAESRKETRGAHVRRDYPDTNEEYRAATIISCRDGKINTRLDREGAYES
ncbi:MAG: FAD-dependent oxidoreductase [Eubacterium sp.]|nr:FAD-dependent oxidoreductase [Eubacterium sp.]